MPRLRLSNSIQPIRSVHLRKCVEFTDRTWLFANEIASKNAFPSPDPTQSVVVGVLAMGGGLFGSVDPVTGVLTEGDVQSYWASLNIPVNQMPTVIVLPVDNIQNMPITNDGGATIQTTIDVETIGACCPSPNLTILVYLASNTRNGFFRAFAKATQETVYANGQEYKPSILSLSWGAPETLYDSSDWSLLYSLFEHASKNGVNICAVQGPEAAFPTSYTFSCETMYDSSDTGILYLVGKKNRMYYGRSVQMAASAAYFACKILQGQTVCLREETSRNDLDVGNPGYGDGSTEEPSLSNFTLQISTNPMLSDVLWDSTNIHVAEVTTNGIVTTGESGSAIITVQSARGKTITLNISVE